MNVVFNRTGAEPATINITDESYVNRNMMGEETAYIEFFSPVPVGLRSGDYCVLLGHTYFVLDAVIPIREKTRLKYQLTLYGTQYELEKAKYFILDSTGVDQTAKTTYNCTPAQFLAQLIVNMKRLQPAVNWLAGECVEAAEKDVELNDNNCLELLKNAAELWEVDYFVDELTVNLRKTPVSETPQQFEVGLGKGLREITANKSGESNVITRLYAFGSNTNMPSGQVLTIPPVDAIDALEVIEGIKTFEDIYPRIQRTIAEVAGSNNQFRTASLGFAISDYLISGSHPLITFQTGELKGLDFRFSLLEFMYGVNLCAGFQEPEKWLVTDCFISYGALIADGNTAFETSYIEGPLALRTYSIEFTLQMEMGISVHFELGGASGTNHIHSGTFVQDITAIDDTPLTFKGTGSCVITNLQYRLKSDPSTDSVFSVVPYQVSAGVTAPGSAGYNLHAGDKFVIWGISMPTAYITAAELELFNAAAAYLETASKQKVKLNVVTDDLYFARNNSRILPGETLEIKSDIIPQFYAWTPVNVIGYKQSITRPYMYSSLVVGDVYFRRPWGTMINVLKAEKNFKSSEVGTDKYYRHVQAVSSDEWTVIHYLDKHPAVTTTDTDGKQIEGVVTYLAPNLLKINFSAARSGFAECN